MTPEGLAVAFCLGLPSVTIWERTTCAGRGERRVFNCIRPNSVCGGSGSDSSIQAGPLACTRLKSQRLQSGTPYLPYRAGSGLESGGCERAVGL